MNVEIFNGDASELSAAFDLLVPQLSKSNPPPSLGEVKEMLASDAVTQFVARDDDGRIIGYVPLKLDKLGLRDRVRAGRRRVCLDDATAR